MMISFSLLATVLMSQQPLTQEQLLNRATALYDRLAGPYTQVGLRVDQGWQELTEDVYLLATPSAFIALNRDGSLRGYHYTIMDLDSQDQSPRISLAEARQVANDRFLELCPNFTETYVCRSRSEWTPSGPTWAFTFAIRESQWLFGEEFGAGMTISALTGQVIEVDGPRLPIRPSWVSPSITAGRAEATMLDFLQSHARGRLALMRPVAHQVWVPRKDFLTPSLTSLPSPWRNYEHEKRGVLIYTGRWSDTDGPAFPDGSLPIWDVFVDPQTGRVIGAYTSANVGVFGGGSPVRKPVASQWDLGVGPLTVSYRGRTADVAAGDVADLGSKKLPKDAEPIRLVRGRLVLLATYSRSTGLLYLPSLGRYQAGRPNAALCRVLTSPTGARRRKG